MHREFNLKQIVKVIEMKKQKIVLGSSTLATYPEGGGHWSVFLQYLLGLQSLGHQVILMECFISLGDKKADEHRIDFFFKRLNEYGFKDKAVIISFPQESIRQDLINKIICQYFYLNCLLAQLNSLS